MYAIKGSWVGQTFALAISNESGGRKARIRRSKEERKAMVESFIKKYQSLNNGKFPSLNLTHKEVGGSFYTVREIVRDIIQENKVLGPAKFSSEKQKFDGNTRGSPLESASMGAQDYLFQLAIESPAVLNHNASASIELNVHGNEQCTNHEVWDAGQAVGRNATEEFDKLVSAKSLLTESFGDNKEPELVGASTGNHENVRMDNFHDNVQLDKHEDFDAEQLVDGSQNRESDKVASAESSVSENFEVNKESGLGISTDWQENDNLDHEQKNKHDGLDVAKVVSDSQIEESAKPVSVKPSLTDKYGANSKSGLVTETTANLINPTKDIVVETFPLRYVIKDIYTLETTVNDTRGLSGELEKFESRWVKSGNDGAVLDTPANASEPVVQKVVNNAEFTSSGELVMNHESLRNEANNLLEVEDLTSGETSDVGTQDRKKAVIMSHNELASLETIDESQEMTGAKARDHQNTICTNNLKGAKFGSIRVELTAEKLVMLGSGNDVQKENQALKESKPTLDRLNLESWEGAPKKPSEQESNPLLAFLKALVSAFMKILSE